MFSTVFVLSLVMTVSARRVIDLSHTLDVHATTWNKPGTEGKFHFNISDVLTSENQYYWVTYKYVEFFEHITTHMDAPGHYFQGQRTMHEIPPEDLIGPGVIIDVTEQAKENPTHATSVEDVQRYERKYGRIPPGAIVIMNSGWYAKWGNPNKVFNVYNTDNINNASLFRFPGWGVDALKMLVKDRQAKAFGSDGPSCDVSTNKKKEGHVYLLSNNIPILEFVANLGSCPPNGTTIVMGSIKTRGGSGGPTRVLAFIDEESDRQYHYAGAVDKLVLSMSMLILCASIRLI